MTLADVKAALLTVSLKVYHFDASGATGNYIVWAEDGEAEAIWADGRLQSQVITGTIDYFTKIEGDPVIDQLQTALLNAGISFRLNSVQHERETEYIHYEWAFEVV
jgi:hypothetical protein